MDFRKINKAVKYVKKNGIKKSIIKLKSKLINSKTNKNINIDYSTWILNNEASTKELNLQKEKIFDYNPKISVVIPMYNTNSEFFRELIESFENQTYDNFEVCLADGSKNKNNDIAYIIENSKIKEKIKYNFLESNHGISSNTNEALKLASGDYIALVDHDDTLSPFAFYEVVKALNENENTEFIYSDEDILQNGKRINPHFKPDFSPDTLRSYNYICHLTVIKKTLIDEIGMFISDYDGAQDYDIILRATEKAKKIVHIPKILYHWRSHISSTAGNSDSKSYVLEAGKRAIESHLKRLNLNGKVNILEDYGRYRLEYDILNNPKVSIIIPNKDSVSDLKKCINSILDKSTYSNYEIIVIENNSENKSTFEYYNELENSNSNIKVVKYMEKGFNYSKINNFGVTYAKGEYIILLNNDITVITPDWIENMLMLCQRKDVGIVGAKLLYPDKTVQHAGVVIGIGSVAGHVNKDILDSNNGYFSRANIINNFSSVTAACLMVKKEVFDEVNGLEEKFVVAFNDIDFCLRVREKGYLVVYTPYSKLYHYESKTRGLEDTKEKIKRFEKEMDLFKETWYNVLQKGDPYYNVNFSLDSVHFDLNTKRMVEK